MQLSHDFIATKTCPSYKQGVRCGGPGVVPPLTTTCDLLSKFFAFFGAPRNTVLHFLENFDFKLAWAIFRMKIRQLSHLQNIFYLFQVFEVPPLDSNFGVVVRHSKTEKSL